MSCLKKLLFFALALAGAIVFGLQAQAGETARLVDGNTLVIEETQTVEKARVQSVPAGLTAEQALTLVTRGGEVTVLDSRRWRNYVDGFQVVDVSITKERTVSFTNGVWVEQASEKETDTSSAFNTILSLWMPLAMLLLLVTAAKKPLYAGFFPAAPVCLAAWVWLIPMNAFTGAVAFVGWIVGVFVGGMLSGGSDPSLDRPSTNTMLCVVAGAVSSFFGSLSVYGFTLEQGDPTFALLMFGTLIVGLMLRQVLLDLMGKKYLLE